MEDAAANSAVFGKFSRWSVWRQRTKAGFKKQVSVFYFSVLNRILEISS